MSGPEKNQRHFSRIPFDAEYRIANVDGNHRYAGHVIDLSLKGALIERPENLPLHIGDVFMLDLLLGNGDVHIQMQVKVVHVHDKAVGMLCEHLDLESMTHLCRFIELNLGSHDLLKRELEEMLQFKMH